LPVGPGFTQQLGLYVKLCFQPAGVDEFYSAGQRHQALVTNFYDQGTPTASQAPSLLDGTVSTARGNAVISVTPAQARTQMILTSKLSLRFRFTQHAGRCQRKPSFRSPEVPAASGAARSG
jgi:hypothetical protein